MSALPDLERRHPEWLPWLAVVGGVLDEAGDRAWDRAVPDERPPRQRSAPLLAGAVLELSGRAAPLLDKLMRSATRSGAPALAGLGAVPRTEAFAREAFRAALDVDDDGLARLASGAGAGPDAFRAVAALLPVPFLHACSRCWSGAMPPGWTEGFCPCCGAWPALAEVCGVERKRFLRCGRCGSAWQAACLSCPYCGMTDHGELGSLVPGDGGSKATIEVCNRCRGYVKAITALRAGPPAQVLLDDLASVELDLAAAARGYRRPGGSGYALGVTL